MKDEEKRKQAFIEYQKTGKMNDIVRQEFEAYEKEANQDTKKLMYGTVGAFLLCYTALFGVFVWKLLQDSSIVWILLCSAWLFVTGVAGWIIWKWKRA